MNVFIECVETILCDKFGHSRLRAKRMVRAYRLKFRDSIDDSYFFHQGPWRIATAVQFTIHLKGDRGDQIEWEVENGIRDTPRDVLEFLRESYWRKLEL